MYDDDEDAEHTPQMIEAKPAAPAPVIVQVIETEDGVLSYTQKKRQQIVTAMMGDNGEKLNNLEKGDKMVVLAALDGMDRAALGRKRIKSEEKTNANAALAQAVIAQVLMTPGAMQAGQVEGARRDAPKLTLDIPDPVTVPGEMDSDAPQMNFDTFMAQSSESGGSGQQDSGT
jgi:hypothetical protein